MRESRVFFHMLELEDVERESEELRWLVAPLTDGGYW